MRNSKRYYIIKEILSIITICVLGSLAITFSVSYVETFNGGILYEYSNLLVCSATAFVCLLTVLCLLYIRKSEKLIFKLTVVVVIIVFLVSSVMFFLKKAGLLSVLNDVNEVRKYIEEFGPLAWVLFVALQILQVTILPIPSILMVTAGVLMFGVIKGALLSSVGIILGSLMGFFFGRLFGVKAVKWMVGERALNKGLKLIEGKDKTLFSLMFLLPFFPDDMLCFVAGLTNIKAREFVIIVIITRFVSVFVSSLSIGNMLIPYDKWWGICIWFVIFATIIYLVVKIFSPKNHFLKK